jgi:hypothetical protein
MTAPERLQDSEANLRESTWAEYQLLRAVWALAGTEVTVRTCLTTGIDPAILDDIIAKPVLQPAGVHWLG